MVDREGILFTAFEPSGDTLAAAMIPHLKRLRPEIKIWALGGAKMQAQGAEVLEHTTDRAAMHLGVVSEIRTHQRRLRWLKDWMDHHPVGALVPVDSPAANWSICALARRCRHRPRVVHLAAPQLWAWAPWRIRKLRRLTDHVLCLLPFEPPWFAQRGVPASFVGHPLFNLSQSTPPAHQPVDDHQTTADLTVGLKLALLPGSRLNEIRDNWPTMLQAFIDLRAAYPALQGRVAAIDASAEKLIQQLMRTRSQPGDVVSVPRVVTRQIEQVIEWADIALVVSGTATLQVAAHHKPMVVLYNLRRLTWHLLGRWLVSTRTFSLPNLLAQSDGLGHVVPEFVPHFWQVEPVVEQVRRLIEDAQVRQRQQNLFDRIAGQYADHPFGTLAAKELLRILDQPHQDQTAPRG